MGCFAALGGMFVTSEMFFPTLLAAGLCAPFLFWEELRVPERRKRLFAGMAGGAAAFLMVAWIFWPAGLTGAALAMLRHYTQMSHDVFPVSLGGRVYPVAPKWAYLYWYLHLYRPYFLLYVLGLAPAAYLACRSNRKMVMWILLTFLAVLLFTAHRAHIIGPEYLAHILPMLSITAASTFAVMGNVAKRWGTYAGAAGALVSVAWLARFHPPLALPGMDARSQQPRWAAAARFLKSEWSPGDQMLAPAYGTVARWYVIHVAGVPAQDWQIEALPDTGARAGLIRDLRIGAYRFVAAGSTFADHWTIDPQISWLLKSWPVVWRSTEPEGLPSRLIIYHMPRGVSSKHPLPQPPP